MSAKPASQPSHGGVFQMVVAATENARVASTACDHDTLSRAVPAVCSGRAGACSWSRPARCGEISDHCILYVSSAVLYKILFPMGGQRRDCRRGLASVNWLRWQTTLARLFWIWCLWSTSSDDSGASSYSYWIIDTQLWIKDWLIGGLIGLMDQSIDQSVPCRNLDRQNLKCQN